VHCTPVLVIIKCVGNIYHLKMYNSILDNVRLTPNNNSLAKKPPSLLYTEDNLISNMLVTLHLNPCMFMYCGVILKCLHDTYPEKSSLNTTFC